ncbi:hypothetical protein HU200_040434 [Digitaria exilis]|uniref:Cytochrome P450 n=1 Tax=Digitaria exilis TaxID=1010633 RepID=A0A835B8T1_9POAL|nr:hypothetical protein HU200_040434 [Digitaria exilis]
MEQPAFYYLCLLLALLLPLLLLLKLLKNHDAAGGGGGVRLPPGPWRLPVIGSLHHLIGKPLVHRALTDLARRLDAPLMYLKLGEVPVVVATVVELLSARRVQSFRHVREDEVARLVADVAATPAGEAVNVSRRIAVLIADSAVRSMIGDRFTRRDEFLVSLEEGFKLVSGFNLGDLFPSSPFVGFVSGMARKAQANHRKSFELMDCAIKQHEEWRAKKEMEEDLVDVLLRVQKEGALDVPLTMGIIKAVILELFSAGSETSATTLQWAMAELMKHPEVMKKAQAELRGNLNGKPKVTEDDLAHMKYMKLVIKETLRLHLAAPLLLPREAGESCKILGYDVPKGTTIFVNAWAIERFECATIDFKGTDFEYIPFGAGRRICPGIMFAQSNIELTLAALLYHFDWELVDGLKPSELDMAEGTGLTVRKKNDLLLHPIIRVPPQSTQ